MNRSTVSRAAAALAFATTSLGAQAGTVTFHNWTWGNGNAVQVTSPGYSGAAGGFRATLAGFGGGFDGAVDTYCVELTESFYFGVSYPEYTLVSAASYFSAAKAEALNRLVGEVMGGGLFAAAAAGAKDDQSTALQLAIWNIVYDTDASLGTGSFSDNSSYKTGAPAFVGATDLLQAASLRSASPGYELFVLKSVGAPGHQDQLIWRQTEVPEPASLALAGLALGAAAFARRRRA